MKEIKPTGEYSHIHSRLPRVFLAGSIEMDKAEQWQQRILHDLLNILGIAYNPRRDQRNSSREQSLHNHNFVQQVHREEDHIILSDLILFYFDPHTKSPITIGEFNLVRGMKKNAVVLCPEGFWRKGNIDIACERSKDHIRQVHSYDDLIQYTESYCLSLLQQRYTQDTIEILEPNEIFVFGSNEEGKHYGGSAKKAHEDFGAERGIGSGPTGQCYAIPTMQHPQTERKEVIQSTEQTLSQSLRDFFVYTRSHPEKKFLLTKIGCGVSGWGIDYIKSLFWQCYDPAQDRNIIYPIEFEIYDI
ncbi:hypothetical protein XF24_00873 [candidate division SR1 bacterium Aalborg_AAW-1]|nr:hypothetical protein XF24_00873 [candidate division SR1 bacterium Aalborg_AAW-1]